MPCFHSAPERHLAGNRLLEGCPCTNAPGVEYGPPRGGSVFFSC